jgi:WD40 repeat protein
MHVSRSETHVVSGHNDCSIKIWNSNTKEMIYQLADAHADPVSCVRVSADENCIVSMSKDDSIKIWDIRMQKLLHTFEHELFKVGSIQNKFCISPNSQYVVAGTKEGSIVFYDMKLGECEGIVKDQHKSQVIACEWQPQGDGLFKLASIDDLGGLLLWGI